MIERVDSSKKKKKKGKNSFKQKKVIIAIASKQFGDLFVISIWCHKRLYCLGFGTTNSVLNMYDLLTWCFFFFSPAFVRKEVNVTV